MLVSDVSFKFLLSVEVHFGTEALSKLPALAAGVGANLLLVTSPELHHAEQKVRDCFAGCGVRLTTVYLDSPEPSCAFIDETARALRPGQHDGIIGVGGGSALDCAKSLAIALTHCHPMWDYANLSNRPPRPLERAPLPVFAVPTTAGTGSEVTPYAVLTNTETTQKGTIQQPEIFPRAAFVDPSLTRTMPPRLTAATGLDALAHALESCMNVSKPAPFSEVVGKEAIRLIFQTLPAAVHEPHHLAHRSTMAWASTLAGMAIAHRGTTTPHAIAEPLGAISHLPHAHAVTLCLVPVLRRTWRHAEKLFEELHGLTPNAEHGGAGHRAELFVREVERLISTVGMKETFRGCLEPDAVAALPARLLKDVLAYKFRPLKQHPVEFDQEELAAIIHEIVHG